MAFPLRFERSVACVKGLGVAVHWARQLVIVASDVDNKLHCYHLSDGEECSVVGRGFGAGDMQFEWVYGGVCVTPSGTLLVADHFNHRVPEMDLDEVDRFVRVFGQGDGAPKITGPVCVDCNGVHVAVSGDGASRVCVLSYTDGSLVGRVGSVGPEHFVPRGIKLLADGSGIVVADSSSHRVMLLSLAGNVLGVQSHASLKDPNGIVQCAAPDGDVAVLVSCPVVASTYTRLMKISFRSGVLDSVDMLSSCVYDMATLPGGGLVALNYAARCFHVFTSVALRMNWVSLAVIWQRRH